jgi:Protein of unknown function (DUF3592)
MGGGGAYVAFQFLRASLRSPAAESWPMTEGTLQSGRLKPFSSKRKTYWFVEVSYSYSVDGQYYGGYFEREVADEQEGVTYLRQVEGTKISVRYRPDKRETSTVLQSP